MLLREGESLCFGDVILGGGSSPSGGHTTMYLCTVLTGLYVLLIKKYNEKKPSQRWPGGSLGGGGQWK